MIDQTETHIVVQKVIDADPDTVFALLADPQRHSEIDGSGMLVGLAAGGPVTAVGQTFTMSMHNQWNGAYRTVNEVTDLEPGRRISWTVAREGNPPAGVVWTWEVEPAGAGRARVTHTYDWAAVTDPAVLERVTFPRVQPEQMRTTIDRLAAAAQT